MKKKVDLIRFSKFPLVSSFKGYSSSMMSTKNGLALVPEFPECIQATKMEKHFNHHCFSVTIQMVSTSISISTTFSHVTKREVELKITSYCLSTLLGDLGRKFRATYRFIYLPS